LNEAPVDAIPRDRKRADSTIDDTSPQSPAVAESVTRSERCTPIIDRRVHRDSVRRRRDFLKSPEESKILSARRVLQRSASVQPPNDCHELERIERFGKRSDVRQRKMIHALTKLAARAEEEDRRMSDGNPIPKRVGDLEAVAKRHLDVEEDRVGSVA
jgi:hypothetical protein